MTNILFFFCKNARINIIKIMQAYFCFFFFHMESLAIYEKINFSVGFSLKWNKNIFFKKIKLKNHKTKLSRDIRLPCTKQHPSSKHVTINIDNFQSETA
jgi:hypothetical protein